MDIQKIIINMTKSFEDIYEEVEKLQQDTERFFFIDMCMFRVEDGKKHSQVDCFFNSFQYSKNRKCFKAYFDYEKKFLNIFEQIWLYNKTLVYGDNNKKYIKKAISNSELRYYNSNFKSGDECCSKDLLDILVKISSRDVGTFLFYFEEFNCLIIPLWSCMAIYFGDTSKISVIEKIINVNGLYLRRME